MRGNIEVSKNKSLFRVFPSILILNVLIIIISIFNILARMVLIDSIVQNNVSMVLFYIAVVVFTVFGENIVSFFLEASKLRITHKYSLKAVQVIAEKCAKLSLTEQENRETQSIVKKTDEYFKKATEYADAIASFIKLALIITVLFFLLRNTSIYVFLLLSILVGITFYANIRSTQNTFGFWQRYMNVARRYNYFSDLQTKREYAYERRVYQSSHAMDKRFSEAFDQAAEINKRSGISRFRGQAFTEGLIICTTVFALYFFANQSSIGHISLGEYAAITEVVSSLLACLSVCAESIFKIREFSGLYSEMNAFLTKPETQTEIVNDDSYGNWTASVQNISFRYPGSTTDAISDFSFRFEKGKHYGLVGINGSGKTTFVKLLLGLYEPAFGIIKLTVVTTALFQDFQIYPITAREYMLMGNRKGISDDQLYSVLRQLNCTDLKNGLDTVLTLINGQGTMVSKGQLQKLAIARAFLSDADFIILDEPTASLDPISEREIYLLSQKLLSEKTVIFISHRLGAVSEMDEILVMDKGKLIESGTHDSLMASKGVYSMLYLTQRGMYVEEHKE